MGENIPRCIKAALDICAYDTIFSLAEIDETHINDMEKCVNQNNFDRIKNLKCSHYDYYRNQVIFKFLPGHSAILSAFAKIVKQQFGQIYPTVGKIPLVDERPFVLQEMIKTADMNNDKSKNSYSDVIRYFSTYVFLLCGRSCYELLHRNLPIPSISTIRK